MRWNCPHCQVGLEVSDDQISVIWRFSLCPKCMRFGLIHARRQSAVKVDRAPAGESFIRASVTEDTPIVIPARRRGETKTITRSEVRIVPRLPEPLPDVPDRRTAFFPKVVLLGCFLLLAWNGFRYLEITRDKVEISDRVTSKAMAPERIELGATVQSRGEGLPIHNGPGNQFPVIGALETEHRYKVLSAQDNWYQIDIGARSQAWVSQDQIIPAN